MSVSLQFEMNPVLFKEFNTALEKNVLDRKTNHHDLTKTETEEIFVLSTESGSATKADETTVERQVSSFQSGSDVEEERNAETEVQCCVLQPCAKARGCKPRRVKNFSLCLGPQNNTRSITQMMLKNLNFHFKRRFIEKSP